MMMTVAEGDGVAAILTARPPPFAAISAETCRSHARNSHALTRDPKAHRLSRHLSRILPAHRARQWARGANGAMTSNKTLIELPTFAILGPSHGPTHPSGRPDVRRLRQRK
jgi:hypothetical protein